MAARDATQWNREATISRNGSGVYSLPAGSLVTNGQTSDATDLNTPLQDIETDMNTPRPIVAGGTGASSASAARTALGIGTIGTQAASSVAITGGAIDGTAIGGSTPAAGAFTTLSSSGAATLASAVVSGNLTFGGTALTDITGADTKLVSGTAGSNTDFGLWNADGDLVGGSMTYTRGSLIVGGAAAWGKLAVGTSGQVLQSDGTDAAWATLAVGGVTLLGTLTTTSGASQSLTSLDLSDYKFVVAFWDQVSGSANPSNFEFPEAGCTVIVTTAATGARGFTIIDLANGIGFSSLGLHGAAAPSSAVADTTDGIVSIASNLTTASTTISVSVTSGAFDNGSIKVYGVK